MTTPAPVRRSFLEAYQKHDRSSIKDDGTGFLQKPCSISVMDFGVTKAGEHMVQVNGRELGPGDEGTPVTCHGEADLKAQLPAGFFEEPCTWEQRVRWIDVEGTNGEVIEMCLHLLGCDDQSSFNMLVDPAQRSMALDLDGRDGTNVLVMALKSKLTDQAAEMLTGESKSPLYDLTDVVEDETVSYLCRLEEGRRHTLLITLQGGMEDNIFCPIREEIRAKADSFRSYDAVYLVMRLVRASSDSLWSVLNYIDCAVDLLEKDVKSNPGSQHLFQCARLIEHECASLVEKFVPFQSTLFEICAEFIDFMGPTKKAWRAVAVQNRGMLDRLKCREQHSRNLVQIHKDHLEKLDQIRQKRLDKSQGALGLVLAVFSPLSFIAGIYGMNFVKPDGTPGLPELEYGWAWIDPENTTLGFKKTGLTGYEYFWILCGSIVIAVIFIYIVLGLIVVPVPKKLRRVFGFPM